MKTTMAKESEPKKPSGPQQVVFKLTPENEKLLEDWKAKQEIAPTMTAVMNVALRAYLMQWLERDERKKNLPKS